MHGTSGFLMWLLHLGLMSKLHILLFPLQCRNVFQALPNRKAKDSIMQSLEQAEGPFLQGWKCQASQLLEGTDSSKNWRMWL